MRARVIHQDAPHQLRSYAEKVCPVFPRYLCLVDEPQIRFVYQRSRFQRVRLSFSPQVGARQPTQFRIDHGHQTLRGFRTAVVPLLQDLSDFVLVCGAHRLPILLAKELSQNLLAGFGETFRVRDATENFLGGNPSV
jgi:hypothetical protein